jgi:hypothetical protein
MAHGDGHVHDALVDVLRPRDVLLQRRDVRAAAAEAKDVEVERVRDAPIQPQQRHLVKRQLRQQRGYLRGVGVVIHPRDLVAEIALVRLHVRDEGLNRPAQKREAAAAHDGDLRVQRG